jgi:hypothetical protein
MTCATPAAAGGRLLSRHQQSEQAHNRWLRQAGREGLIPAAAARHLLCRPQRSYACTA